MPSTVCAIIKDNQKLKTNNCSGKTVQPLFKHFQQRNYFNFYFKIEYWLLGIEVSTLSLISFLRFLHVL